MVLTPLDGYSLELAFKGYDNDYGTNWLKSCSEFGTPGSDPYAQCDANCVTLGSDYGGIDSCNPSTGQCLCGLTTGYYPVCQNGNQGCLQCAEIPTVTDCIAFWKKNGTEKYAYYNWTTSAPAVNGGFCLQCFASSKGENFPTGVVGGGPDSSCDVTIRDIDAFTKDHAIFSPFQRINDNYQGNNIIGGYVYAFEASCDTSNNTATTCEYYVSGRIPCIVVTSAPTTSPKNAPTQPPIPERPSNSPTVSPTFACPRYWIENDDVCGYSGDRCSCTEKSVYGNTQVCCFLEPIDFNLLMIKIELIKQIKMIVY